MIDETTDTSNAEQVVIVIRWVSDDLSVHEFIGLYHTSSIQAQSLVAINDSLLRLNLKWKLCRGQCYDGVSVMSGAKSGVATILWQSYSTIVIT